MNFENVNLKYSKTSMGGFILYVFDKELVFDSEEYGSCIIYGIITNSKSEFNSVELVKYSKKLTIHQVVKLIHLVRDTVIKPNLDIIMPKVEKASKRHAVEECI